MPSLVGKDIMIELDSVCRQFEPYLQVPPDAFDCRWWRPCCVTWDAVPEQPAWLLKAGARSSFNNHDRGPELTAREPASDRRPAASLDSGRERHNFNLPGSGLRRAANRRLQDRRWTRAGIAT